MASEKITLRIVRHIQELWDDGSGFTLEYLKYWAEENGHTISLQTISRVLRGKVKRLQPRIARCLAEFIAYASDGALHVDDLLNSTNAEPTPDDPTFAIQKALREADLVLKIPDWRKAYNLYLEALQAAKKMAGDTSSWRCIIYERLGNLHLVTLQEPVIARAYYETGMGWARSPNEQAALLCRLAETHAHSPRIIHYIEEVTRLMDQHARIRHFEGWLEYLRACAAYASISLEQATGHAAKALKSPELPDDIRIKAAEMIWRHTPSFRPDIDIPQTFLRVTPKYKADPVSLAREQMAFAVTLKETGDIKEAMVHFQAALDIFEKTDLQQDIARAMWNIGTCFLNTGDIQNARLWYEHTLALPEADALLCYCHLCKSWWHDKTRKGLVWANKLLQALYDSIDLSLRTADTQPPDVFLQPPFSKVLDRLAQAECIFRHFNETARFIAWIDAFEALLLPFGMMENRTWYAADTCAKEPLSHCAPLDAWQHRTGSRDGCIRFMASRLRLESVPLRSMAQENAPHLFQIVQGDVILEATLHSGQRVEEDIIAARRQANTSLIPLASGSGGIYIRTNAANRICLFAHMQVPGDAMFRATIDGKTSMIGRGIIGRGAMRLRLEKKGGKIAAFAGDKDPIMYCLGSVAFPYGDSLEIGIFGEASVDLYTICRRSYAEFMHLSYVVLEGRQGGIYDFYHL